MGRVVYRGCYYAYANGGVSYAYESYDASCEFECRLASGNQNISAYNDEDALLDVVPRETSHSNSVHERTES